MREKAAQKGEDLHPSATSLGIKSSLAAWNEQRRIILLLPMHIVTAPQYRLQRNPGELAICANQAGGKLRETTYRGCDPGRELPCLPPPSTFHMRSSL